MEIANKIFVVTGGQFLVLPHPEVAEYIRHKTSDYDRWLHCMRRLQDAYVRTEGG